MKPIRLNLGAGSDHKTGWINSDIDPTTKPDVIIDLTKKLPYKDASVDEVLIQDVLEHLLKTDGEHLISEIQRILKPGGTMLGRVPDVESIVTQFVNDPPVMMEFIYGTTTQNGLWGVHKFGYTEEMLDKLLKTYRFKNIKCTKETTNLVFSAVKKETVAPKPHVLVIEQAPDWGGAEEWMATIVTEMRRDGWAVTGVTDLKRLRDSWSKVGASTIHLPVILDIIGNYKGLIKSLYRFPYALWWYNRLLNQQKKRGVNCIVASGFSEKLLVTFLAKSKGMPIIWFEYGPLKKVFERNWYIPKILYRAIKNIPEKVLTISEVSRASLIRDARISQAKIEIIKPGVFIPKSTKSLPEALTVGHLSRLTPEKGQRMILAAFQHILKKHPEARLKIAGRGPDDEYLQKLSTELGLADRIEFLGFIDDKTSFYNSISVFLFASTWPLEGFGMVMAEAMAHGRPVIAVDNGPAKEVIGDSGGMIVPPDPIAIAEAVEQMAEKDLIEKSKKAHLYASQNFEATIQVTKIKKIIADVVNYFE